MRHFWRLLMNDYFPLKKGLKLVYDYESSEFEGKARAALHVLEVAQSPKETCATVRLSVEVRDHVNHEQYQIKKTGKAVVSGNGIVVGGRIEFPLPPAVNAQWDQYPDANKIVSMTETVRVPAGTFKNCLKVESLLAGGDAGSAERYYAPGVGYISEKYNEEGMQAVISLAEWGIETPPEPRTPRKGTARKNNKGAGKKRFF